MAIYENKIERLHAAQNDCDGASEVMGRYGYDALDLQYLGSCVIELNVLNQIFIHTLMQMTKNDIDNSGKSTALKFAGLHSSSLGCLCNLFEEKGRRNKNNANYKIDFLSCLQLAKQIVVVRNSIFHAHGYMNEYGKHVVFDDFQRILTVEIDGESRTKSVLTTEKFVELLNDTRVLQRKLAHFCRTYFSN